MGATNRYTYSDFAKDAMNIAETGSVKGIDTKRFSEKALALLLAQEGKKQYNAEHPKKGVIKGASVTTQANGAAIRAVLTDIPMTAIEINAATGLDLSALQVSNACKFIDDIKTEKVIRSSISARGLRAEKEYTAYFIGEKTSQEADQPQPE